MNSTKTVIKVGIGDLKIAHAPNAIRTTGLGSCVGVVVYDLPKKIAGLAHVMLPDSQLARNLNVNMMKYADTAIDMLIAQLIENGARKFALQAKMAGGAQMFQFSEKADTMRIGPRNAEAVEKKLVMHHIPIVAADLGGNCGRTIEFDTETGQLLIRTVSKGEKII
ncbi:chemotaxis protein CheD [Virgibacillus sp. 179-BFC.A HS]|uniref:Probable chemoreceptor glutamine deamidase CheD n=1 Tax=Tigheibacillus jepli TaxID=3035914 RepID=A0ABU5CIT7_9BACI|nr:chemotaxis protein CheD [Virgibacillus sp. 179-BFC.A HS]MDY0405866.1 chemotaxis protein CheD [Virgibacillus sp. 179-BFC.A HS]